MEKDELSRALRQRGGKVLVYLHGVFGEKMMVRYCKVWNRVFNNGRH